MSSYQITKNPFLACRPYVYAIMWTQHNIAYVGVRFASDCNPNDLWKTYFTSSKYVQAFRQQHGEPDHIEIIETFLTANEAVVAEQDIISTFGLHCSPVFLNKACGKPRVYDDEARKAAIEARRKNFRVHVYNGQAHTLTELEKISGQPAGLISYRIKQGMTVKDAVETSTHSMKSKAAKASNRRYEYDGTLYNLTELAAKADSRISAGVIKYRLDQGMTIDEAIEADGHVIRSQAASARNHKRAARYDFHGKSLTIREVAKLSGWSPDMIRKRMRDGYSIEEAALPQPRAPYGSRRNR